MGVVGGSGVCMVGGLGGRREELDCEQCMPIRLMLRFMVIPYQTRSGRNFKLVSFTVC